MILKPHKNANTKAKSRSTKAPNPNTLCEWGSTSDISGSEPRASPEAPFRFSRSPLPLLPPPHNCCISKHKYENTHMVSQKNAISELLFCETTPSSAASSPHNCCISEHKYENTGTLHAIKSGPFPNMKTASYSTSPDPIH